jgi:Cu2+-exporting ATPase
MALISALLSGCALVAGAKLYQENKRKRETPWTVYAEKVGVLKHKKKSWLSTSMPSSRRRLLPFEPQTRSGHCKLRKQETRNSPINKIQATIQTFKLDQFAYFSVRRQQMEEIVGSEISEAEKELSRMFNIASVNLAVAGMSLFYSPFIWLTVPLSLYCNWPLFKKTIDILVKEKRVTSYITNPIVVTTLIYGGFYFTLAAGSWFNVISEYMLVKSEDDSKKKMLNLFGTQPRSVWVRTDDGVEVEIPFEALQRGDIVMVSAGQTIPVDGVITTGSASIDQHKLTGESQPFEAGVSDSVLASTIVLAGKIGIRVSKTGEETVAMQIGKILDQTASFKNSLQSGGEVIADRLALPTLGLSALFLPIFGYSGAVAVLTNEFGYKMRIFAPASMLTFLNIASQEGILIKDGRSLEISNQVDTVVFDKTGTLTLEQPTIGKIHTYHGYCEEEILRYAAAAEDGQTHPIAKAILTAANERELAWPKMVNAKYEMGHGIQVNLSDRVIRVGSEKFMVMNNIEIPIEAKHVQEYCHKHGDSLVMVAFDSRVVGVIELHATIRPEAKEVIERLRQRGMSMYIISGDHEAPTKKLAETLGIENYFANTLPENKAHLVSKLQEEGKSVCFVGDGINDSIALKKANLSVSLRGATMIATDTAQVVLMDGSLNKLEKMFDIAQELEANMKSNLLISTVPSAICLSGIVFLHWGLVAGITITTSAMLAGIANSLRPLLNQPHIDPQSHISGKI